MDGMDGRVTAGRIPLPKALCQSSVSRSVVGRLNEEDDAARRRRLNHQIKAAAGVVVLSARRGRKEGRMGNKYEEK